MKSSNSRVRLPSKTASVAPHASKSEVGVRQIAGTCAQICARFASEPPAGSRKHLSRPLAPTHRLGKEGSDCPHLGPPSPAKSECLARALLGNVVRTSSAPTATIVGELGARFMPLKMTSSAAYESPDGIRLSFARWKVSERRGHARTAEHPALIGMISGCGPTEKRKRAPPKSREMPSPEEPVLDGAAEVSPLQTSPTKEWYKQKVHESANEVQQLKKKVKTLQQKKRRLSKRIDASRDLIEQLKEQNLLSEKELEVFQASFSADIQQLLKRTHEKTKKSPPELRAFALTLHYYSPRAYGYVRAKFNNALPNQRTLCEWYKALNGDPGFISESFEFIKNIVQGRDEPLVATIMVDDMSIKKHVQLVGNKVFGYVDLCMEMSGDSLPEASNACVFMLVALNMRLKLTKECISRVTSAGVIAASLTFDGAASNFSMASFLGADLSLRSPVFNTSFQCSEDCQNKVFVILDACHMIKLVRNCLGSVNHLTDIQGLKVKWSYIEALEALQQKEGLHLGNKLTKVHMEWAKQKMKVRLAVQTLSSSVADALDFCEYKLKLPQFQGAHATAEFIRIFDRLFDILNSRNPLARSFKAPLRQQNAASWKSFFHEAEEYIRGLKDASGRPVIDGLKKTGFVGLIICIRSVTALFDALVATKILKYLLTHKMSQDHLETFFGCVRGKGGHNNNPTACQFRAAYKRLLFHTEITSSDAGSCCRDVVSILNMSSAVSLAESPAAVTSHRRSSLLEPLDDEHDYTHRVDLPQPFSSDECCCAVYSGICGSQGAVCHQL
ncbi:hypothetical protein ISCGN_002139 [Ixodes scapularis]